MLPRARGPTSRNRLPTWLGGASSIQHAWHSQKDCLLHAARSEEEPTLSQASTRQLGDRSEDDAEDQDLYPSSYTGPLFALIDFQDFSDKESMILLAELTSEEAGLDSQHFCEGGSMKYG